MSSTYQKLFLWWWIWPAISPEPTPIFPDKILFFPGRKRAIALENQEIDKTLPWESRNQETKYAS